LYGLFEHAAAAAQREIEFAAEAKHHQCKEQSGADADHGGVQRQRGGASA